MTIFMSCDAALFLGARTSGVLVAAFRRNELLTRSVLIWRIDFRSGFQAKLATREGFRIRQQAASVRAPEAGRSPLLAIWIAALYECLSQCMRFFIGELFAAAFS